VTDGSTMITGEEHANDHEVEALTLAIVRVAVCVAVCCIVYCSLHVLKTFPDPYRYFSLP